MVTETFQTEELQHQLINLNNGHLKDDHEHGTDISCGNKDETEEDLSYVNVRNRKDTQMSTPTITQTLQKEELQPRKYKWEPAWRNVILLFFMHSTALYGLYLCIVSAHWKTILFSWFLLVTGLQGVMAGSHRLWAHKTYKAKLPLKILLVIMQTISLQYHVYDWATFHRIHHKYVDTDADPHNSRRGLFYSQIGWLFIEREPEFHEKFNALDFSDLRADKVLMFQKKYYYVFFAPIIGVLIPTAIPWYFWGEDFATSFYIASGLRYCLCTHITFLVNSFAHTHGTRPYDKNLRPTEIPIVSVLSGGEGWHNYHHVFPWDYKAGEFGHYRSNLAAGFIDLMAAIGWAYDLKSASEEMIMTRIKRTGDGSRKIDKLFNENLADEHDHGEDIIWGWGDKDMTEEDLSYVKVQNRKNA